MTIAFSQERGEEREGALTSGPPPPASNRNEKGCRREGCSAFGEMMENESENRVEFFFD